MKKQLKSVKLFSVDVNPIDHNNILDIYRYCMKKKKKKRNNV